MTNDTLGLACEHGMLARCCEVCEMQSEITALRAEVERETADHANSRWLNKQLHAELVTLRSQLSARDAELRPLRFDQRDLVALVGRLCRALPQDDDRRTQAMAYLTRKNLLGSILRTHDGNPTPLLTGEPGPGGKG